MITARTRLEAFSFWRMIVFLLNGIIFILIGLQLPAVVSGLATESWATLLFYAAAVSATVVLTRILWVFSAAYLPRLFRAENAPGSFCIPPGNKSPSWLGRVCAASFPWPQRSLYLLTLPVGLRFQAATRSYSYPFQ